MEKYFRITAYNTKLNLSAIFDCRNIFDNPSDFETFLAERGFDDVIARKYIKYIDCGNVPLILDHHSFIACRACAHGEPDIETNGDNLKTTVKTAYFTCLPKK